MYKNTREAGLDAVFGALADASRRSILERLSLGETSVSELGRPLDMTMPGVLKHLRVLESAGLVTAVKDGRVRRCQLAPAPVQAASDWLAQTYAFWNRQLDGLTRYLDAGTPSANHSEETSPWPRRPLHHSASRSAASTAKPGRRSSGRGRIRKS